MKYTREDAIAAIMDYFKENEDEFSDSIESLDSWDGCLGDERRERMDAVDELFYGQKPSWILDRAFYGGDEKTDDGFCPWREYFYFDGYGNLVSTDERDYSDFLDENIIEDFIDRAGDIDLPDDVVEIIDSIGDDEEEE